MRIPKLMKLLWGSTAVVIGILTFSSLTTLERQSATFLPPDLLGDNEVPGDGFPIKFINLLSEPPEDTRKNVLFLMSDDLRPQLGAYDSPYAPNPDSHLRMITPNLDSLAGRSLLLERAYVQLSMCGPSRASILTGRRPDTTKVWNQKEYWRNVGGNFTTIPQYFKDNGYITANIGKIFHPRKASGKDDPLSWSEPIYQPPDKRYWRKMGVSWRGFSEEELAEIPHPDQLIADEAVQRLRELAVKVKQGQRFFLGVGFLKPHLPFTFPNKYLNLYPLDSVDLPPNPYVPQYYPETAYSKPAELLSKDDLAKLNWTGELNQTLNDHNTRLLRRAYFACVSFIDAMVGKVLHELDQLGLAEDTVISFIGDHGWHLGENGRWGKHTNMEQGTHAPMMIHVPGKTDHGVRSSSIVEFVDLFPTLAHAAGLQDVPPCPDDSSNIELCSEGINILPLIDHPEMKLKLGAYSQHKLYKTPGMGYSVKTERFRYTEWVPVVRTRNTDNTYEYQIKWDSPVGSELYDHNNDLNENINRADDPNYKECREDLMRQLRQKIGNKLRNVLVPFE